VIQLKTAAALTFAILLLTFPETALNAALSAMYAWYISVAPALFPFMALMPMLTCTDSVRIWQKLLGRISERLLKLPGAAVPAAVIAMTAGSPAGAYAAVRICSAAGLPRSQLERLLWCTCGLSPAFLVTGVGASMLSNAADGRILLRAQLAAQLAMLLITRNIRPDQPLPPPELQSQPEPVRTAVANILAVCGYMMLFAVAAAVLTELLRSQTAGLIALCILDAPSGARALAQLPINREAKLLLLAAQTGMGGLCVFAQNLAACAKTGVRTVKYLLARLSCAALCTAATALQLRMNTKISPIRLPAMEISALIAVFFIIPVLFSGKKTRFLTKENLKL